ncbi:hypothetical protein Dsin_007246 [Dipteronia sinensis]|uniref:Uncharacterized protein n=1 Tax=Dipteronia sinensis TaxID=43782 RepID=A0AAE0B190_9ROSI|nr:hypothetical protein Dsin_007246 [Dipteronia sinensis]
MEDRGLGVRDLVIFNQVMLAKQAWRLDKYLNSLAGHLLKSCYYPHRSFMNVNFQARALLCGKVFVGVGSSLRKAVGGGLALE